MKTMRRFGVALLAAYLGSTPALAEDASATDSGMGFAMGGELYIALQNWPDVGAPSDTKMGFGFGGGLGLGLHIDEMKFLVGPHFAMNRWSADYSNKPNSATDSIYVEMADAGMQVSMEFDDILISLGKGTSEITSGMIVNGSDIRYSYSGNRYNYSAVSIGMKFDSLMFSIGSVSYEGFARYCNRADFRLGVVF